MKKFLKVSLIVLLVLAAFAALVVYDIKKPRTIAQSTSMDKQYTLSFMETESPMFFGPSGVALVLEKEDPKTEDQEKQEIKTYLYNDGKRPDANNWRVRWFKDGVEASLLGEEQEDEVFTFSFIKREER